MFKLYSPGMDLSNPVLKVRYVANYLGLEYELVRLDLMKGEHKAPEYQKIHPAGKVPVLVDGDFVLFESNVIIRYLAQKNNSDLYPQDLQQKAIVDQWVDFVSFHVQNGITRVLFNKVIAPRLGAEVDANSMKCGYEFIERFIPIVDEQLGKFKYLAGDKITLADFTLLAVLDPLEAIEIDPAKYPNVNKWRNELKGQEFYQKIHKFYGEALMTQQNP